MSFAERALEFRRRSASAAVETVFGAASLLGRAHPAAHELRRIERISDIPYRHSADHHHRLDIYRPRQRRDKLPVVMYIHGGSFRILSKDSHWLMGVQFASAGMLCFNINYRLAPQNRYPVQLEDAAAALEWVVENAERFGGDPSQIVLAGESAGANLATALTVASTFKRPEDIGRRVWDLDVVPRVLLPSCGILEVTRPERFVDDERVKSWLVMDRIRTVAKSYVPGWKKGDDSIPLADPLTVIESDEPLERPWPPTFVGCGDADPIANDSLRLDAALRQRGVDTALELYAEQPHAFQILIWREEAKRFWDDSFAFLSQHLSAPIGRATYGLASEPVTGVKSSA